MRSSGKVLWDYPTRIAHWLLAVCVILNLFFLEEGEAPHRYLGYTALAVVILRGFWGLRTQGPSRLSSSFALHPSSLIRYLRSGMKESAEFPGHNPVASWVYLGMWLCVAGLALSGWMMGLDAFWGEEWLQDLHARVAWLLQISVGLHLLGILIDSVRYRRHTWFAMINGKK